MTNSPPETEDLSIYRDLIKCIRSTDEDERRLAIIKIPNLVLAYFEGRSELVKQILLLIYNLNADSDIYENLTLSNGFVVVRHLLRLYMDAARGEQRHEQVEALIRLVQHSHTSQMLIELTNILYHCLGSKQLNKEDKAGIDQALESIREKAAANMYPDALLMIHSIMEIK